MTEADIKIIRRYFQIAPKDIAFLKFIIESYDGIAMQRTLNAGRGEIEIMVPKCNNGVLDDILADLKQTISITEIKKPVDYLELVV